MHNHFCTITSGATWYTITANISFSIVITIYTISFSQSTAIVTSAIDEFIERRIANIKYIPALICAISVYGIF